MLSLSLHQTSTSVLDVLTVLVADGLQRVDDRLAALHLADQLTHGYLDGLGFGGLLQGQRVRHLAPVYVLGVRPSLDSAELFPVIHHQSVHSQLHITNEYSMNYSLSIH